MTGVARKKTADVAGGHLELLSAVAIDAQAGAPEWVNIIPIGDKEGRIVARDGREFVLDDPEGFVAASNDAIKKTGPQPVDKDHELQSWPGGGPALGWAEEYELRDDGVYARTDWLSEGAGLITSKKYRYTSSVIRCELINVERDEWGWLTSYDLRMKKLEGFTLTNQPALEVSAIFSANARNNMDMTALLALYGLPPTASKEEFYAKAKEVVERNSAAAPSLENFVPRAEYDRLKAELAAKDKDAAEKAAAAEEAEREQLLQGAMKDGKVAPASAEFFRSSMRAPGGVELFRKFLASAPTIAGPSGLPAAPASASGTVAGLTAAELESCRVFNQKPEDYLKTKQELAQRAAQPK